MVSHEAKLIRELKRYGKATDDILALATKLPLYIVRAARRRLVQRGEVVAWKVFAGRMVWMLVK